MALGILTSPAHARPEEPARTPLITKDDDPLREDVALRARLAALGQPVAAQASERAKIFFSTVSAGKTYLHQAARWTRKGHPAGPEARMKRDDYLTLGNAWLVDAARQYLAVAEVEAFGSREVEFLSALFLLWQPRRQYPSPKAAKEAGAEFLKSPMAHIGGSMTKIGALDEALRFYRLAIRSKADNRDKQVALDGLAELGDKLRSEGKFRQSAEAFALLAEIHLGSTEWCRWRTSELDSLLLNSSLPGGSNGISLAGGPDPVGDDRELANGLEAMTKAGVPASEVERCRASLERYHQEAR